MATLDSLTDIAKEKYAAPAGSSGKEIDFTGFMKSKPVVAATPAAPAANEASPADEKKDKASSEPGAPEKEKIGYDGKEIYNLTELAETITGPLVDNPGTLTELIFGAIEFVRGNFYPGMLFRLMFAEKERDKLEDVLARFIDIDLVGETDELIPIRKDLVPTKEEQVILIKWRKFVKGLNNLKYNDKEAATFKNYIHSKVKNLSVDHLIAMFGPVIGLMAMEAGKIMPFYANRKQSILNTYTNR